MSGPQPTASEPSASLDAELIRRVGEALADLNIARKSIQIYPETHEQVQRTVHRAMERMEALLADLRHVTLIIMEGGVMVSGMRLDPGSPLFQEIAEVLRTFEIVALTFTRGLEGRELLAFLQLLALDPQQTLDAGGLAPLIAQNGLMHIQARLVDYSVLQATQEDEIRKTPEVEAGAWWRTFVTAVLAGADTSLAAEAKSDPVCIAGLINRRALDAGRAVRCFETLIAEGRFDDVSGQPAAAHGGRAHFSQMLQELTPDLRQTFLSVAFDQCAAQETAVSTQRLMTAMGRELTLQMVRHARADGKAISPSLVAFIRKMGPSQEAPGAAEPGDKRLSSTSVRTLMSREAYETYVEDEYDRLLKGVGGTQHARPAVEVLAREIETDLTAGAIDRHTGYALMRLMTLSGDQGGYRDWARQLTLMLSDLVHSGAFDCLGDILAFVRAEHRTQADADKRKVSGLVLERFLDPDFIAELLSASENGGASDPDLLKLIRELGEPAAAEIVESLHGNESAADLKFKFGLLEPFGAQAAAEALKRLNAKRPERLVLLLKVIGRFGAPADADAVRPLLEHAEGRVRMEALSTLVRHRNPWGLLRLRELVNAEWSPATERAVEMAGRFRVKELIPSLTAMVRRRGSVAIEYPRRAAALRALGRIGDPGSLAVLRKLARRRGMFSGKLLIELKRTLFESLGGYPSQAANELIRYGLKHKDEVIQEICRRLLRRPQGETQDRGAI